jgi:PTH1 family peptidyl-tRNA hydrolase
VRLGIGPDFPLSGEARSDYVLRPFPRAKQDEADEMVVRAADAVRMILRDGVAKAMNEYNRRLPTERKEDKNIPD